MMKNISKILAIAFVAMVFGISAKAQTSATAAAVEASATIVTPISITNDVPLAFGIILPDAAGGTVAVDATTGAPTYSVGTSGIASTVTAAHFAVAGAADQAYSIDLPADGAVVLSGAGADMSLSAWETDLGGLSGTLDASGDQEFNVGATLTIGAAQASGAYTGTFDVTVTYE